MHDESVNHLLIFGAGGFGREVAWLAKSASPGLALTFIVDRPEFVVGSVDGLEVALLQGLLTAPGSRYVVALGDPAARARAVSACEAHGLAPITLAHPGVDLTGRNVLGAGSVVSCGSVLTTGITLGRHAQIHANASIGHDVSIGDYTTIAPGANVAGHVSIGVGVYIGIGATIINGSAGAPLTIGDGAVIAAGACVTGPVELGTMVAGVPAVRKR